MTPFAALLLGVSVSVSGEEMEVKIETLGFMYRDWVGPVFYDPAHFIRVMLNLSGG